MRADRNGIVLHANAVCAPLLHLWGSEVGSAVLRDYRAWIVKALRTEATREIEIPCEGRLFSVILVPILEYNYVNFYGRDITERKRSEDALAARTRQLEAIRSVTTEITRELDLNTLLALIHQRAAGLVGGSGGAVHLWDETAQLLVPRAWHGLGPWFANVRLRLGEAVVGTVAQRRQGMVVTDYRNSPYAHPPVLERTRFTAVLAEPLLYGDRLLGVITINNEGTERQFSEQDRQILGLFAAQAAIAIENARLYQQATSRAAALEQLWGVGQAMSRSLALPETLDRIVQTARDLLRTDYARLTFWDGTRECLTHAAQAGAESLPIRHVRQAGDGVAGVVAKTSKPLIVNDYKAFRLSPPEKYGNPPAKLRTYPDRQPSSGSSAFQDDAPSPLYAPCLRHQTLRCMETYGWPTSRCCSWMTTRPYPAQPLWASAEPTWPSAGYCTINRFPGSDRNLGTASPQRFLRAEDDEAHTAIAFAN